MSSVTEMRIAGDFGAESKPIESRHHNVQQHYVWLEGVSEPIECLTPVRGFDHAMSTRREDRGDHFANGCTVVNGENWLENCHTGTSSNGESSDEEDSSEVARIVTRLAH